MTNEQLIKRTESCIGGWAEYYAHKKGSISDLHAIMHHSDKAFDDMLPSFEVSLNHKGCVIVYVTERGYSLYLHKYMDDKENDVLLAQSSSRNYIYNRIYALMQII